MYLQQVATQDPISPSGRGRHNTGKDGGKGTPAWSESKPSGIDILGGRLADNRHPSVQVHRSVRLRSVWLSSNITITMLSRGSTNMDLSRDEEAATQDRSNAPITNTKDPEQVRMIATSTTVLFLIGGLFTGQ